MRIPVEDIEVDFDVAMEVASHEALIRQTYKDSVGVLTWCVGMTNATGHAVERYIGKPASLQHCMNLYAWALTRYADGVRKAFAGHRLTKAEFAAALSFHWNTGAIERATWVKHWKAGRMSSARNSFLSWRKPPEIVTRRQKEADLMFGGKWSNDGTMLEFVRLTKRMTPDWSSGKRVNVSKELAAAFRKTGSVGSDHGHVDHRPDPQAPVSIEATGQNAKRDKAPATATGIVGAAVAAGTTIEQMAAGWGFLAGIGLGLSIAAIAFFFFKKWKKP